MWFIIFIEKLYAFASISFKINYFQVIVDQFSQYPKIGICGGVCVIKSGETYIIEEETNLDHIRGAIKAYRRDCFESIGGLLHEMGWDTVDEHFARFKDWDVVGALIYL